MWPLLIMAGTALLQAQSQAQQGADDEAAGFRSAAESERQGRADYAQGLRTAALRKREGQQVMGDARAAIAAGGGDTVDPGSLDLLSKIDREAEYNRLGEIYEAESGLMSAYNQGAAYRREGRAAKRAGRTRAAGTLLESAASAYGMRSNTPSSTTKAGTGGGSLTWKWGD